MKNLFKVIAILAIIGIVIISSLFVLDVITSEETQDMLQKTLLVLGIVAIGGVLIGLLGRSQ